MTERNEDWLDRRLREDARVPLADDGFTRRVLEGLPARAAARPWLRPALIVGSTLLGSALAVILSPVGPLLAEGLLDIARWRGMTPGLSAVLAMTAALGVAGFVLAAED
jgi:hypothetical protein